MAKTKRPRSKKPGPAIIWSKPPYRVVKTMEAPSPNPEVEPRVTYHVEKMVGEDAFDKESWIPVMESQLSVVLLQMLMDTDTGVTTATLSFSRPQPPRPVKA